MFNKTERKPGATAAGGRQAAEAQWEEAAGPSELREDALMEIPNVATKRCRRSSMEGGGEASRRQVGASGGTWRVGASAEMSRVRKGGV